MPYRTYDHILTSALIQGKSYEEAAEMVGVSVRTVQRRMDDPDFQRQLAFGGQSIITEVAKKLLANFDPASDVLIALLKDPSPTVRRLAVKDLVSIGLALNNQQFMEYRIQDIEAQMRKGDPK